MAALRHFVYGVAAGAAAIASGYAATFVVITAFY
jgi:hypothetical protein